MNFKKFGPRGNLEQKINTNNHSHEDRRQALKWNLQQFKGKKNSHEPVANKDNCHCTPQTRGSHQRSLNTLISRVSH